MWRAEEKEVGCYKLEYFFEYLKGVWLEIFQSALWDYRENQQPFDLIGKLIPISCLQLLIPCLCMTLHNLAFSFSIYIPFRMFIIFFFLHFMCAIMLLTRVSFLFCFQLRTCEFLVVFVSVNYFSLRSCCSTKLSRRETVRGCVFSIARPLLEIYCSRHLRTHTQTDTQLNAPLW